MVAERKVRIIHIIETVIQHIVVLFFLLILWELFKNYSFKSLGTWHIILCTLGFALCMAEALILFSKDSVLLTGVDRVTKGKYHAVVMFIAFLCITIGISLKIYQKADEGRHHFTTTHGRLGLSAWILVIISIFAGMAAAKPNVFLNFARPVWFKLFHLIVGAAAYIIGIVTVGYGLHYLQQYTGENGRIALLVFLIIYVVYSLIGSVLTCYNLVLNK
ncbi:hypothetical protein NQ314_018224 [Rhamnusium bicolor]|uniref:ascorbate ferrireductase (transmembrane) n=1 Tax=Rhamnusium bicolor TaxID=1586634 RepID=A0AAV8WQR7_9CUCU|nr:hypothetical protein NQ314_018224 [Rhamnusium bicolor]